MKIVICDLCMTKLGHVYFNSAFIRMLSNIYDCEIEYYSEKTQGNCVRNCLKDVSLSTKSIIITSWGGAAILLSDIINCLSFIKVLFLNYSKADCFYILNRLPITMFVINCINFLFGKKIYYVIHGEVEYLVNRNMRGGTVYYYQLYKFSYKISSGNLSYIILGEPILNKLFQNNISFGKAHLLCIDHPYDYNYPCKVNSLGNKIIKCACIGSATKRKNSHYLKVLANFVKNRIIILAYVGGVGDDMVDEVVNSNISFFKEKLSPCQFEEEIDSIDYSLCFYDNRINLAVASGSFFDSIKYCKPILALYGNPFVDYYFEKLGNIGYRFHSIKEMAEFINTLPVSNGTYDEQVRQLRNAQNILSLESITRALKKQLLNNS